MRHSPLQWILFGSSNVKPYSWSLIVLILENFLYPTLNTLFHQYLNEIHDKTFIKRNFFKFPVKSVQFSARRIRICCFLCTHLEIKVEYFPFPWTVSPLILRLYGQFSNKKIQLLRRDVLSLGNDLKIYLTKLNVFQILSNEADCKNLASFLARSNWKSFVLQIEVSSISRHCG